MYQELPVPAGLGQVVARLWMLEAHPLRRFEKILPLPSVHVIVNLSTPYRLFDRSGAATLVSDAFVSGIQSEYLVIESPPRIRHVGAELLPAALPAVTDAAPPDVVDRVQDAGTLWTGVDRLVSDVRSAPTPAAAIDVLARFLLAHRTGRVTDPLVAGAVAAIHAEPSGPIADLAARGGVSHRTLIARFRAATGLTPKAYAQIWRFHTFVQTVHEQPGAPDRARSPDWAALAAASGFSDQPHVIRAFRRFSGWTPADYYRRVVEFGPDAASFVPLEDVPITRD